MTPTLNLRNRSPFLLLLLLQYLFPSLPPPFLPSPSPLLILPVIPLLASLHPYNPPRPSETVVTTQADLHLNYHKSNAAAVRGNPTTTSVRVGHRRARTRENIRRDARPNGETSAGKSDLPADGTCLREIFIER